MASARDVMMAQVVGGAGFIAALDQSGGSTPGALKQYGYAGNEWSDDAAMYDLIHQMRVRIITAPAFASGKVVARSCSSGRWTARRTARPCRLRCGGAGWCHF